MTSQIIGNTYDKYETRNPIARFLMRGFFDAVDHLIQDRPSQTVLEVGCGEGHLLTRLLRSQVIAPQRACACDLDLAHVTVDAHPSIEFQQASAYELPWPDNSFDLVLCCEVLEHLEDPHAAMRELARVAKHHILISTPWEPVWRALNLARLRYVATMGNTPGHIQHFGRSDLVQLCESSAHVIAMRKPLPWTMLLATPK